MANIKRLTFGLLISVMLISKIALSQSYSKYDSLPRYYSYVIKISPYAMLWGDIPLSGEYGAGIEYILKDRYSFETKLLYMGKGLLILAMESDTSSQSTSDLKFSGFRIQADLRYYLKQKKMFSGWFISPHLSFSSLKISDKNSLLSNYISAYHLEYSLLGGYQLIAGRFSIEATLGICYRKRKWVEVYTTQTNVLTDEDLKDIYFINTPFLPRMGFSIGYMF